MSQLMFLYAASLAFGIYYFLDVMVSILATRLTHRVAYAGWLGKRAKRLARQYNPNVHAYRLDAFADFAI